MAIDVSLRSTGITPEPTRESPSDRSGAILGQTMAAASNVTARAAQSSAQAAENFGQIAPSIVETARNAQVGFHQAQLDIDLNQQMQDWVEGQKDPAELKLGFAQAGKLDELQPSIWDALGTGKITPKTFETTVTAFEDESKALKAAHDQGMLSPSEFVSRLKSTIRKHATQNPGVADELYNHGMRTLQLSGAADLRDIKNEAADAAIKQQELMQKNLLLDLRKYNVPFNYSELHDNPNELVNRVNRVKDADNTYKSYTEGYKMEELTDDFQKKQFFRTDAPKLAERHKASFGMQVSNILNSGAPDDEQLIAIQGLTTQMNDVMADLFRQKGVASHPDARRYQEDWKDYTSSTLEQINGAKTQADKLKILENKEKIVTTLSNLKLYDKLDPAVIGLLNRMPSQLVDKMFFKDTPTGEAYLGNLVQVVSESLKNKAVTRDLFTSEGDVEPKISNGASTMLELNKSGQMDMLHQVIKAYSTAQQDRTLSESEQFNNMDDYFKISSRRDNLEQMKELSNESKVEMQTINTNYMQLLGKSLNSLITDSSIITGPGEFKASDFTVEELPNGGIMFKSDDPNFETKLNREYAVRFNNLVKTSAKLFNMSEKQASDRYKAVFSNTFSMGELGRVGLEGKVTEGIDDRIIAFESGNDPTATNKSAVGLGQFIPPTWMSVMEKFFPKRIEGLNREEILALRTDEDLSRQAVSALRKDNQRLLKNAKVPVTDTTVGLAYSLGAPEAIKLLKASNNDLVKDVLTPSTIGGHIWLQKPGLTVFEAQRFMEKEMKGENVL